MPLCRWFWSGPKAWGVLEYRRLRSASLMDGDWYLSSTLLHNMNISSQEYMKHSKSHNYAMMARGLLVKIYVHVVLDSNCW